MIAPQIIPAGHVALQGYLPNRGPVFLTVVDLRDTIIRLLRSHLGNSLWGLTITDAISADNEQRWDNLISQLASQARDGKHIMVDIVGSLCTELLLIYRPL